MRPARDLLGVLRAAPRRSRYVVSTGPAAGGVGDPFAAVRASHRPAVNRQAGLRLPAARQAGKITARSMSEGAEHAAVLTDRGRFPAGGRVPGQASPLFIAISRARTLPPLIRRPSCSHSLVTQARRPQTAAAVRSDSGAGT
jgi:hypothetical protein